MEGLEFLGCLLQGSSAYYTMKTPTPTTPPSPSPSPKRRMRERSEGKGLSGLVLVCNSGSAWRDNILINLTQSSAVGR